ncbi:MAG TPA: hypothetical protein VJH37_01210 [Candidatus Nanoarchaeia archaeon]|nr:hypothetical protein [Candidatus Nanoarchaeia archaeon]
MEQIFRSIFWIGLLSVTVSLFVDFILQLDYFVLAFGCGLLLIVYSLYEQFLWKRSLYLPPSTQPSSQASSQPVPAVAKTLIPSRELLPLKPTPPKKQRLLSRFFGHFFHRYTPPQKPTHPGIASLDNVKSLFNQDLHLQQKLPAPGTFQRPVTQQPLSSFRSIPSPRQDVQHSFEDSSPKTLLPFEEGLEHYIPTKAEQLPHDHHNRYAEDREILSRPSDTRYQQVSQQQRTPSLQQQSPHHLSLLHYLHYQDRKHERWLFIALLILSIILIAVSLVINFQQYISFVVTLLFLGLILLSASIAELIHLHHHHLILASHPTTTSAQPTPPATQAATSPLQSSAALQVRPTTTSHTQKPASLQPIQDTEHLETLIAYIRDSLQQQYPAEAIRTAAQKSGWPDALINQALIAAQGFTSKKKKVVILVCLVGVLLISLFVMNSSDLFLLPYWIDILSDASPQFYFIMIGVFSLIIILLVNKVRKSYKAKHIRYHVQEQRHVSEIKEELERKPTTIIRGTYETDFDRLYHLISEKKVLTITEVAQGFNVSRKEAEEWGKILNVQGLIELHYPTVGDLELRWKK